MKIKSNSVTEQTKRSRGLRQNETQTLSDSAFSSRATEGGVSEIRRPSSRVKKRADAKEQSKVGGFADEFSLRSAPRFAVFDIDGTLIRWQLYHAIVHTLGKRGYILRPEHEKILQARLDWKNRRTDEGFHDYEAVLVDVYLKALPHIRPEDYLAVAQEVFEEYKDQIFTYTRDLIAELKAKDYLLFAISGSQAEVIHLIASYYGFDDAIGCELEQKDDAFTGQFTTPIFDKKKALETLVQKHGATYEESYAVGDSPSDAPMLEAVEHPIAFNPDLRLHTIARDRDWPIVVERKNVIYTF